MVSPVTFLLLLVFLLGPTIGDPLPAPPLPRQTAVQSQVLARATRQAVEASADKQGQEQFAELLSSAVTRSYLRELLSPEDSHLADVPTPELVAEIQKALSVAEIVHNFGSGGEGNCGIDVDLYSGMYDDPPYFFNQWMLQILNYSAVDGYDNQYLEAAETSFFGFPPFANVSDPDWSTAANRPVYGALNIFRSSLGNAQCGPIAAVFSRPYIAGQFIAAPIDTGLFYAICGHNQTTGWKGFYCHAWPAAGGPLGVDGLLQHLLLPFVSFFNITASVVGQDAYVQYNTARLLTRLLSRSTYLQPDRALRLNFMEGTWGYFEANAVVTLDYPRNIKMLIGAFEILFGTKQGEILRSWCIEQDWVLAWAHNPEESLLDWNCNVNFTLCNPPDWVLAHGTELVSTRILDPEVLSAVSSGKNCTAGPQFEQERASFESRWEDVAANVPVDSPKKIRRALMDLQWDALTLKLANSSLAVEPLYPSACRSNLCSGVRILDATCVCPA